MSWGSGEVKGTALSWLSSEGLKENLNPPPKTVFIWNNLVLPTDAELKLKQKFLTNLLKKGVGKQLCLAWAESIELFLPVDRVHEDLFRRGPWSASVTD